MKREPTKTQVKSEKAPSPPKKRRVRKSKASSDIPKSNISDSKKIDPKNLTKGGKQKRPAVKRKATATTAAAAVPVAPVVAAGTSLNPKVTKQSVLGDMSSNLFTPSNDEDEEFRLTVETMGKNRQMSVFKDSVEDSPGKTQCQIISIIEANGQTGRTESPLEDHRYVGQRLNLCSERYHND